MQIMTAMVEQQSPGGDHALQNTDGADNRGDGDPGNVALNTGGLVIPLSVGGALVLVAADQVS
ncbi:hypothetical protein BS329_35445 [Amycolatopsis coloradensis]|uniref:Uncharacterized protein n=1 Tax=Amycolatopsis coloradensis TaxID=76021 RepID=A0A1R0KHA2_9PSEU|nr:hypothetical protein BS329_35445 [Amycolatopsis coloradensis]